MKSIRELLRTIIRTPAVAPETRERARFLLDAAKDALREESIRADEGFTVEIAGKGTVRVSAGSVAKLRGILPELVAEHFMALSERRRATLVKAGLVKMAENWSRDRKPSVSTKHAA
jgi:hypothetical protein